jgi:hypothetical protein
VPDVWNSAPQVWRWRDWIVDSLNADAGYDRLVQHMLAADEIAPGDQRAVVATGYLVRSWYALNPNQWMRDLVEHTGKAFLGLTLNCCHCHDHKYDPLSQEEYFRFRAFFEPLGLRQDRVRGEADPGPFQKYNYSTLRKVVQLGRVTAFDEQPDAKTWMYHLGDERDRVKGKPAVTPGAPAFLGGARLKIEPVDLPPFVVSPGLRPFVREEELARAEKELAAARAAPANAARLKRAEAALASLRARIAADSARASKDGERLARAASKAERAAALAAAEEAVALAELARARAPASARKVAEAKLAAARRTRDAAHKALAGDSTKYTPLGPTYPSRSTGRRKALALWLTDPANPLPARVAVNHVWRWHFGRPLVETVADFGRNGKPPSHPELLDWLAAEFVESGWSLKHLHRLIVTSDAYRRHSAAGALAANLKADPEDRWLWRFPRRRVEAEVVRDCLLAVAGELDQTMGGQPLDNREAETARRRSLYLTIHPEEGGRPRFLELFDAPDPCDCYRRTESVMPQQALALTNSALVQRLSGGLARALLAEVAARPAEEQRAALVRAAFARVLSRAPTAREQALCESFLARPGPPGLPRAAEGLVRALFSHDDFLTIR